MQGSVYPAASRRRHIRRLPQCSPSLSGFHGNKVDLGEPQTFLRVARLRFRQPDRRLLLANMLTISRLACELVGCWQSRERAVLRHLFAFTRLIIIFFSTQPEVLIIEVVRPLNCAQNPPNVCNLAIVRLTPMCVLASNFSHESYFQQFIHSG